MEIEILSKEKNILLNREELDILVRHYNEPTPKRTQILSLLSKQLKKEKNLIILDYLNNNFGRAESTGYVKIYLDLDSLSSIESKAIISRHSSSPKKEAPAKDAPAKDAPAKDAPAKDAPAKDAPAKDAPAKDALVKKE